MSLPNKLIAVGMRYNPGAETYLRGLKLPCSVALRAENNKEATGGIAYTVYHRGKKIAYIREADLATLKRELHINISGPLDTSAYDITQVYPNYLVLKLSTNPCAEVSSIPDNFTTTIGGNNNISTTDAYYNCAINPLNKPQTKKEETMFEKIVTTNKTVAVNAAYMEAGRIANNQVAKIVAAKAPLMVKGYVDTPVGKLVLANLTSMAVEQFRPTDAKLKKVSNAMMSAAYQELIQTIDIEGMLNELTSSEGIKNALAAVAAQEEVTVKK